MMTVVPLTVENSNLTRQLVSIWKTKSCNLKVPKFGKPVALGQVQPRSLVANNRFHNPVQRVAHALFRQVEVVGEDGEREGLAVE